MIEIVDERIRLLEPYAPPLVRRRLAEDPVPPSAPSVAAFPAAVLFADISGFTALTESLARRGAAGAEEVQEVLNRCFGLLVDLIYDSGGEVTKFAGDAVLAQWPADGEGLASAVRRAARCGLAIQEALGAAAPAAAPALRLRVAVGAGEVREAVLGGVDGRWISLETGSSFAEAAAALARAEPGQVILAQSARACLNGTVRVRPVAGSECARLEQVLAAGSPPPAPAPPALPAESEDMVRAFVPRVVQARLDAGQMDWLAEFRRVTVLFVNLRGLDSTSPLPLLQAAVAAVQGSIHRYGGSVNQLVADDKGIVLVAGWGLALSAWEDNAVRAVLAALAQQRELADLGCRAAVGLATGVVFAGRRGGRRRQEYAMIGDVVNLAARLMTAADDRPLCDAATCERARHRIAFEELPALRLKGKAAPVAVFRPVEEAGRPAPAGRPARQLIGRDRERRRLAECLADLESGGAGGVVVLEGEPGIGKSHLAADLLARAAGSPVRALLGSAEAIESTTPYYAWRAVFARLLGLDGEVDGPEPLRLRLASWLAESPELEDLLPLLSPLLPFEIPETPLTREMPSQDRGERTRDLLVRLFAHVAGEGGTLLVLEDVHWFDSMSWGLADAVRRRAPRLLLVLTTRPQGEEERTPESRRLLEASTARLRLEPLVEADALALACERLGVEALPELVVRLVRERAGGHPLFTEELVLALRDQGMIRIESGRCRLACDPGALDSLGFPDTVQGVVTSRIDRLPPELQLCVKVASVLGRTFELDALRAVHPGAAAWEDLAERLEPLQDRDLAHALPGAATPSYLFKHAITQEVAYGLLPFEQRRRLHRAAGEWYERQNAHDLAPAYPLLAHHWSRTGVTDKGIDYLEKAGEQACRGFANREALQFFGDARKLVDEAGVAESELRLARWERRLCEAHLGLGQVPEARQSVESSLGLLGFHVPRSRLGLAGRLLSQTGLQAAHRLLRRGLRGRAAHGREELLTAVQAYSIFCKLCYYEAQWGPMVYGSLHALNLAEKAGPSPQLAEAYSVAANIVGFLRWHSLANRFIALSEQTAEACGVPLTSAFVNIQAGHYEAGVGAWDGCDEHLHRALELYGQYGNQRLWDESLLCCAYLYMFRGELSRSLDAYTRLRDSGRRREDPQTTTWGRLGRGRVLVLLGRFREAADEMEGIDPAVLDRNTGIGLHGNLALAWLRLGETGRAAEHAAATRKLLEPPPATFTVVDAFSHATEVYLALWEQGVCSGAEARWMCKALRGFSRTFPIGLPYSRLWDGVLALRSGRADEARRAWRKAVEAAERLRMPHAEALIHLWMGSWGGHDEQPQHRSRAAEMLAGMGCEPGTSWVPGRLPG